MARAKPASARPRATRPKVRPVRPKARAKPAPGTAATRRAPTPRRYFDDPEVGPAAATSHPAFVALCVGEFFYAPGDEFAPFGSDAGSDTLGALQEWTARRRRGGGAAFLAALLASWGLSLPDLAETRPEVIDAWIDDVAFSEVNQAVIATAFGQLKITGAVEPAIVALALAANARERRATARARITNPRWEHAAEKAAADERIHVALVSMA